MRTKLGPQARRRGDHSEPGRRRRGEGSPRLLHGDCIEVLTALATVSVDAVVCDPPYAIGWQNERWDSAAIREAAARHGHGRLSKPEAFEAWCGIWGRECLRVMKPGAFLLAFGSPRTHHRLAAGLEDAGLEIRDTLIWLHSRGMTKSRRYAGGGRTTLKPAVEPIVIARKSLDGTTEETIARHGTGYLGTEACRVNGRDPANAIVSHDEGCGEDACAPGCAVSLLDAAAADGDGGVGFQLPPSSFLYCPKPSRTERDAGCEELPESRFNLQPDTGPTAPARNTHPTLKSIDLMRWLVRLACPDGGLLLDPFMGSGTTGVAAALEDRRFCGIEIDEDYLGIAAARMEHWAAGGAGKKKAATCSSTRPGARAPGRARRPAGGRRRR
jgi:DNA modification methylase